MFRNKTESKQKKITRLIGKGSTFGNILDVIGDDVGLADHAIDQYKERADNHALICISDLGFKWFKTTKHAVNAAAQIAQQDSKRAEDALAVISHLAGRSHDVGQEETEHHCLRTLLENQSAAAGKEIIKVFHYRYQNDLYEALDQATIFISFQSQVGNIDDLLCGMRMEVKDILEGRQEHYHETLIDPLLEDIARKDHKQRVQAREHFQAVDTVLFNRPQMASTCESTSKEERKITLIFDGVVRLLADTKRAQRERHRQKRSLEKGLRAVLEA